MEQSVEQDQRVMDLVAEALSRPPEERDGFMHDACQSDHELYREVSKIVFWEAKMGDFLLSPIKIGFEGGPKPFQAGQIIEERFEIIREIGEGGMGVVYEAFDKKRNTRVAIKAAKPRFQRWLLPELEGALSVRHANICRVNEIHTAHTEHGEIDFLTMELLEGETLAEILEDRGRLPEKEALSVARQLCAGISEAHRCGVIHRDLITIDADHKVFAGIVGSEVQFWRLPVFRDLPKLRLILRKRLGNQHDPGSYGLVDLVNTDVKNEVPDSGHSQFLHIFNLVQKILGKTSPRFLARASLCVPGPTVVVSVSTRNHEGRHSNNFRARAGSIVPAGPLVIVSLIEASLEGRHRINFSFFRHLNSFSEHAVPIPSRTREQAVP